MPRGGSPAQAGKGVAVVQAVMLVGPVVRRQESYCRVARLELHRSRRTTVHMSQA